MLTVFESSKNTQLDLCNCFSFNPMSVILTDILGVPHEEGCKLIESECFTKVNIKSLDAHESENWIYINDTYIPKSFISHMYVFNNSLYFYSMKIYMINGSYTMTSYLKSHEEFFKRVAPHAFVVKNDKLDSRYDINDLFISELKKNRTSIVDAIKTRPNYFDSFIKSLHTKVAK